MQTADDCRAHSRAADHFHSLDNAHLPSNSRTGNCDLDNDSPDFVATVATGQFCWGRRWRKCWKRCRQCAPLSARREGFASVQQALLAGYRPCRQCQPLSASAPLSAPLLVLLDAIEAQPARRWTEADFRALSAAADHADRQLRQRHGLRLVDYARARRLGLALKPIRYPELAAEREHQDVFAAIMAPLPLRAVPTQTAMFADVEAPTALTAAWLETRLGPMLAIADDGALHLLEFVDRRGLEREVEQLRWRRKRPIQPGRNAVLDQIDRELTEYFAGQRRHFATPLAWLGSPFEQQVWAQLQQIPFGQTRSYAAQAAAVGQSEAITAVARANGANRLAIVVPCHRVLADDGNLVGYGGGLARKQWLLAHERQLAIA